MGCCPGFPMSKDRMAAGGDTTKEGSDVRSSGAPPDQVAEAATSSQSLPPYSSSAAPPLVRTFRWNRNPTVIRIETDASPTGLGSVLFVGNRLTLYIGHTLTDQGCRELGGQARLNDLYQSGFDLLAIFISIKLFSKILNEQRTQFYIRSDSTSALRTVMTVRGKSPLMAQLAGEIALQLESLEIDAVGA